MVKAAATDSPVPAAPARPSRRTPLSTFESFRIRSFRFQWSADAVSTWASEMETLILGWYVLVDTNSPFLLGVLGSLRFGGTLLGPFYGVLADRFDRRRMLIAVRSTYAVLAAVLMTLALTGTLEFWHAFVISGISGLVRMSDNILRQSLIADTVPQGSLMNATGLARTTQDIARITGAFIGASLMSRLGIGEAYVGVTAFYLFSVLLALGITVGESTRRRTEGPLTTLKTGVAYMRRSPTIMAVMYLAFLVNLTAFPLTNGLLPVVARDVYNQDENGLAVLVSAYGFGALAGSLVMAGVFRSNRPERMMIALIVVWHVLLLGFAQIDFMGAGLALLVLIGASISFSMVSMTVVLLSATTAEFRGRVMGVRMMAVYGLPMGLLLGGYLSERFGVQTAISVFGAVGLALTALALVIWPALWRGLKAGEQAEASS